MAAGAMGHQRHWNTRQGGAGGGGLEGFCKGCRSKPLSNGQCFCQCPLLSKTVSKCVMFGGITHPIASLSMFDVMTVYISVRLRKKLN